MTTTDEWWKEHGYLEGRELGAGLWLIVARMLFTYRVMVSTKEAPTGEFYCYVSHDDALRAFKVWDGGVFNPVVGWTRHHRAD